MTSKCYCAIRFSLFNRMSKMATCGRSAAVFCRIFRNLRLKNLASARHYSIQPPEWLGGKNVLIKSGRFEFPEHSETFEERLAKLVEENEESRVPPVDIGVEYKPIKQSRREFTSVVIANHRNKDLEQAARLKTLKVSLEEVQKEWLEESGPQHSRTVAEHYGIYRDLFNGDYFTPVTNLNVYYECEDDYIMPVRRGNRIPPSMATHKPSVEFESPKDTLWTLVLTNPDGHLSDQTSEYVHWMVGNIQGNDCSTGEVLVEYMQPIPPKGTGFHRLVFILFEQSQKIDYKKLMKGACRNLEERSFKMADFHKEHQSLLVPKGLAFFQSQWDDSVRNAYHNILDMAEPVYEFAHRPPYHPPPRKYPHKEPFDRYFDRYRDKKDLAEEVLRMKLKMISPFKPNPKQEPFPLIHREMRYKPSWLKLREEMMHRRLEQYKDLP